MRTLVAAPDKFRGTATAPEVAGAIGSAGRRAGWEVREVPLADGGEGFLDAFGGAGWARQSCTVAGPDGAPVRAPWALGDGVAVVEAARASGLALVAGPQGNDPWTATSNGTGDLVAVAATAVGPGGTVVVGIGGTACTDGGWGAFEAVRAAGGLHGASLVGAVDVSVPFVDAARRFGPQKGATPAQVVALADRLEDVAGRYRRTRGVDVADVPGAGAGGGLGGAVLALGGQLVPGVEVVAEQVGLDRALDGADLVVTGEGQLDGTSFAGKVVGSVLDRAGARGLAAVAVVGRATADGRGPAEALGARVVDLSELVGPVRARGEAVASVTEAVTRLLRERG